MNDLPLSFNSTLKRKREGLPTKRFYILSPECKETIFYLMCVISGCRENKQFKFEAFTTFPGQKLQVNFPVSFYFNFQFCFVLSFFGHFAFGIW